MFCFPVTNDDITLFTFLQTGECTCKPGYQGDRCDRRCEDGYYGDGCHNRCRCRRHETCDFITGACTSTCPPGWIGDDCSQGNLQYTSRRHDNDKTSPIKLLLLVLLRPRNITASRHIQYKKQNIQRANKYRYLHNVRHK